MEMDEKPIGLRDEKAEILDKAHLDEQQLNNLTVSPISHMRALPLTQ